MKAVRAYFDNAATTKMAPEVLDAMLPYMKEAYGNPGSIHWMGDEAAKAVREARTATAAAVNCLPSEVFFTSGGTESDNIAIIGTASKKRIVASAIEHSAILETCGHLGSHGHKVTLIGVDKDGMVDPDSLRKAMDGNVSVVSVMTANNVIGTVQRIRELSDIAREFGAYFHTDAVQAFTKTDTDVKRLGVDMLSISGHKIHGPKGVGALFVSGDVEIGPITFGGGQERGLRPSTENVPGIVGLGKACATATATMSSDVKRMEKLRNRIIGGILDIKGSALNGSFERRLCSNAHFRFSGIKGAELVLRLSREGIAVSTASACSAGSTDPSHVMTAIGLSPEEALSSLRISLSRYTTEEEVEILLDRLPKAVSEMRS